MNQPRHSARPRAQRGVALAVLVWFLAAMSLLVGVIVMQARVDVRLTQLHATRARVEAAGDGAIQLALAELMLAEQSGEFVGPSVWSGWHNVGGMDVAVSFTPVSGLIDLNSAPEGLLHNLFASIAELEGITADELAGNVIEWRSARAGPGVVTQPVSGAVSVWNRGQVSGGVLGGTGFRTIEDLLQVPGVNRRIFEAVEDAVSVSQGGQASVDWRSAPVAVLKALGDMDDSAAMEVVGVRWDEFADATAALAVPDGIDLTFQGTGTVSSYRADALVKTDAAVFRRRQWVSRELVGNDGLPWSFFRTEAVEVASPTEKEIMAGIEVAHAGN